MKPWKTYSIKSKNVKLKNFISRCIIKQIGCLSLSKNFRGCIGYREKTTQIIQTLTALGHKSLTRKPHYKVYAHGLSDDFQKKHNGIFKNREWLYDLHWYEDVEGKDYEIKRMNLVLECEWRFTNPHEKVKPGKKKDFYGAVKYDFQKLLVTNADLRILIFRKRQRDKKARFKELNKYFDDAIRDYKALAKNSIFLFIAFDESEDEFCYMQKIRKN